MFKRCGIGASSTAVGYFFVLTLNNNISSQIASWEQAYWKLRTRRSKPSISTTSFTETAGDQVI